MKKSKKHSHNWLNLKGLVFLRLTVLKYVGKREKDKASLWLCKCDCGKEIIVPTKQLMRKQTQSCGCYLIDKTRLVNRTHGYKGTRIYRIWAGMLNRIRNPNSKDYWRYGGRGIKVCKRWLKFENFLADMGEPPTDKHSIDRRKNEGNYCPSNCKWSTAKEQANNRRPPTKRKK